MYKKKCSAQYLIYPFSMTESKFQRYKTPAIHCISPDRRPTFYKLIKIRQFKIKFGELQNFIDPQSDIITDIKLSLTEKFQDK